MSNIEWTDRTWNPVRGCSRVSAGCDNCYAMGQAPFQVLTKRPKRMRDALICRALVLDGKGPSGQGVSSMSEARAFQARQCPNLEDCDEHSSRRHGAGESGTTARTPVVAQPLCRSADGERREQLRAPKPSVAGVKAEVVTAGETALVAALFVSPRGPYWNRPGVDAWDETRDAQNYAGPHPVVAHPPCARWCRLAKLVEHRYGYEVGDDGGLFGWGLYCVRKWGGVLEHPAWSLAWGAHGLIAPPAFGWQRDLTGGWCCEVAQSAYGHRATKLTWLYYVGDTPPPPLNWAKPRGTHMVSYCTQRGDGTYFRNNARRMSKHEGSATPPAFADELIALAHLSRRAA